MRKLVLGICAVFCISVGAVLPKDMLNAVNPDMVSVADAIGEEQTEGDYKYVVRDNGTIKITEYIGYDTEVKISRKIDGRKVTIIGSEAFAEGDYTKIVIPEGVLVIGERAFAGCRDLKKISMADSITTIHDEAFEGCTSLQKVSLPENLEKLRKSVFDGCTSLNHVTVPQDTRLQQHSLGYDGEEKIEDFEIRCYEDSPAQQYAEENEVDYTILASKPDDTPGPEGVEATPEASPSNDIETPKPEATPEQTKIPKEKEDQDNEQKKTAVSAAESQKPNKPAAVVSVVISILAVMVCIIVVSRRRK